MPYKICASVIVAVCYHVYKFSISKYGAITSYTYSYTYKGGGDNDHDHFGPMVIKIMVNDHDFSDHSHFSENGHGH